MMMNMSSSFRAYGKIDAAEQAKLEEARRKTQKRVIIITISSIILVCVVVAAVLGTYHRSGGNGGASDQPLSTSVKAICDVTLYPDTCSTSLSPLAHLSHIQPEDAFKLATQVAMAELHKVADQYFSDSDHSNFNGSEDNITAAAFESCRQLLSLALDHLNGTLFSGTSLTSLLQAADDLQTWLSSAGTYQDTCKDGFENATVIQSSTVSNWLKNSTELTSNSLAIVSWISKIQSALNLRRRRRLLSSPEWLNSNDRKLLQSPNLTAQANIVVAQDGTGNCRNISDALKAVPDKSNTRFVIYVKKGIYIENVQVNKNKWNVVMVGDGMNETIVSGGLNNIDGTPTFSTATFAVTGKGFIARDMGFRNTAGAIKHQAVALLTDSDKSVFYRCLIDAYQDTLYVHTNRQFYRECNITGTVDFIFGNSAVVLQNCNILPRLPLPGQQNTITAQGKLDPNQNTGISIQNCSISPYEDLGSVQTYLGRPWKNYSTTVYIGNYLDRCIDPSGWLPWVGTSAPNTIFYSEFQNYGPGSPVDNRVKWVGVKNNLTKKQAGKFTVGSFIKGKQWISDAGVPYQSGL